mgnify:CR=1 FL=1
MEWEFHPEILEEYLRKDLPEQTDGLRIKNSLMASTGMGLYLCRKLCEKMDIGIRIESEEGEYTKVLFCFGKSTYLTKL